MQGASRSPGCLSAPPGGPDGYRQHLSQDNGLRKPGASSSKPTGNSPSSGRPPSSWGYDRTVCWLEPLKWTKVHEDEPSNTPLHPDGGNMFENMLRMPLLLLTGCALQLFAAGATDEK